MVHEGQNVPLLQLFGSTVPLMAAGAPLLMARMYSVTTADWEHVGRHFCFSVGFTASVLSLDVYQFRMALELEEQWASLILWLYVVGNIALYFFTAAHMIEIYQKGRSGKAHINTHHGDVAVLPLGFVASAMTIAVTPQSYLAAFPFSRSAIYFIPVFVGWVTLNFIGHFSFATRNVTPTFDRDYSHVSFSGTIVACAMLTLIELAAPARYYIVLTLVAAIGMQISPMEEFKQVWGARQGVAIILGASSTIALQYYIDEVESPRVIVAAMIGWCYAIACTLQIGISGIGRYWHVPMALYVILIYSAFTECVGLPMNIEVLAFHCFIVTVQISCLGMIQ